MALKLWSAGHWWYVWLGPRLSAKFSKENLYLKHANNVTLREVAFTVVYSRPGHWGKLLSEQPPRDRAEHGAMSNAVRLNSVLVRISIQYWAAANLYYSTSAVFKLWYTSVWLLYGMRAAFNGTFEEEVKGTPYILYILRFNAQYKSLIVERFISSSSGFQMTQNAFLASYHLI